MITIFFFLFFYILQNLLLKSVDRIFQLGSLQAEMERMKAENKLLKEVIEKTFKDYQELQAKLSGIQQQKVLLISIDYSII